MRVPFTSCSDVLRGITAAICLFVLLLFLFPFFYRENSTEFQPESHKAPLPGSAGSLGHALSDAEGTAPAKASELSDDGFSAVKATAVMRVCEETGNEFLGFYIRSQLPDHITTGHLEMLQKSLNIENSKTRGNQSEIFRKGMAYLFVAIAESILLTEGEQLDVTSINSHWLKATSFLEQTAVGGEISESVQMTLQNADLNHDGNWNEQELRLMIQAVEL